MIALLIGLGVLVVMKEFLGMAEWLPCSVLFGLVFYFFQKLLSVEFFVMAIICGSFVLAGSSE